MKKNVVFSLVLALSITLLPTLAKEIEVEPMTEGEYAYGNGFLDLPNPKLRESIYSGYERDGEFKIFDYDKKQLINSNHLSVRSGKYYFRKADGSEYLYNRDFEKLEIKEITSSQEKRLHVGEPSKLYQEPFFDKSLFLTDVPVGDYEVLERTYNFALIRFNEIEGWVNIGYRETEESDGFYKTDSYYMDTPEILSVDTINGVPVKTWMIPKIDESVRCKIPQVPLYVTIHNTANVEKGAGAKSHAEYQATHLNTWTSWHFSVDNKEIYQSIPMNEIAYHAGDGMMGGNSSTIAIEICENADGNYAQAEKNAAYLTARILFENGLPSDAIRMHKNWSGKNCPRNMIEMTKKSMGWSAFTKLVASEYQRLVDENKPQEPEVPEEIPEIIPEVAAFIEKSGLMINSGVIQGIKRDTTLQQATDFLNQVEEGTSVVVQNKDNTQTSEMILATDMTITVSKGEISQTLPLAILGDVSGDGKISSMDYALVKNQILKINSLSTTQKVAANINNDEKISSMDYAMIKNHILGISQIEG